MILKKVRYKNLESWSVNILIGSLINSSYPLKPFKEVLSKADIKKINIEDDKKYRILGVRSYGKGVYINREVMGKDLRMKKYQVAKKNHLFWCKVDTKNGAFGVVTEEFENTIASSNMTFAKIKTNVIDLLYLQLLFQLKKFNKYMDNKVTGTTNRKYIKFNELLNDIKIPLPDINTQKKLVEKYKKIQQKLKKLKEEYPKLLEEFESELFVIKNKENKSILHKIQYKDLDNWSVKSLLGEKINYNLNYPLVKLGEVLKRDKTQIEIQDDIEYKRVTIKLYNGGIFLRDKKFGKEIGTKKQFVIKKGQFLLSKIDARNGAFGIVPDELDGAIITGNFWTYNVDYSKVEPLYLTLITTTKQFVELCNNASSGTTGRHYLQEDVFLNTKIPLPDIKTQKKLIQNLKINLEEQKFLEKELKKALEEFEGEIFE